MYIMSIQSDSKWLKTLWRSYPYFTKIYSLPCCPVALSGLLCTSWVKLVSCICQNSQRRLGPGREPYVRCHWCHPGLWRWTVSGVTAQKHATGATQATGADWNRPWFKLRLDGYTFIAMISSFVKFGCLVQFCLFNRHGVSRAVLQTGLLMIQDFYDFFLPESRGKKSMPKHLNQWSWNFFQTRQSNQCQTSRWKFCLIMYHN